MRFAIGPGAVAVLIGGVGAGWLAFGVADSARRIIGWAVACAVVAALVEPAVSLLDRRLPRPVAVLAVFLGLGALVGGVAFGVLQDLDDQVSRLKEAAPAAAAELEDDEGIIGDLAADLGLAERVRAAVAELENPSSGVAADVASSAGAWLVCVILTAFLLSWGPRLGGAALGQIADAERRDRVGRIGRLAFSQGRRYALATLGLAASSGLIGWGMCALEDVRAPLALGMAVAAGSVIPGVGVVVGALPAILLEAGLGSGSGAARLAVAFVVVQLVHSYALRRLVRARGLVVGPAAVVIPLVLGFEVYGVGGAYYGAALAVFAVAALDAAGRVRRSTTAATAVA